MLKTLKVKQDHRETTYAHIKSAGVVLGPDVDNDKDDDDDDDVNSMGIMKL